MLFLFPATASPQQGLTFSFLSKQMYSWFIYVLFHETRPEQVWSKMTDKEDIHCHSCECKNNTNIDSFVFVKFVKGWSIDSSLFMYDTMIIS